MTEPDFYGVGQVLHVIEFYLTCAAVGLRFFGSIVVPLSEIFRNFVSIYLELFVVINPLLLLGNFYPNFEGCDFE